MKQQDVKVGQRVRVSGRQALSSWTEGLVGTVVCTHGATPLVEFSAKDAKGEGHDGYADYRKNDGVKTRWYVLSSALTLVPAPSFTDDLKLTPQAKAILVRLKEGKAVTPMKALVGQGISRLSSCIHEIRNVGYDVKTGMARDDQGHKYASYSLTVN